MCTKQKKVFKIKYVSHKYKNINISIIQKFKYNTLTQSNPCVA